MTEKVQIIFDNGKPAFVVIPYEDYVAMSESAGPRAGEGDAFVPFVLGEFIRNPIRVMRIEAGLNQAKFARRLGVSQGYVSRIEGRHYKVSDRLLKRARAALPR